jgi:hypothetical protein
MTLPALLTDLSSPPPTARVGRRKRFGLRLGLALAALVPIAACANLAPINAGECGNKVTEDGEDCDGDTNCYAPGTTFACRFQCSDETPCLEGACGNDNVCRRPSGEFEVAEKLSAASTVGLAVGDLDADGFDDVVRESEEVTNVYFLGSDGTIDDTVAIEREVDDAPSFVGDFTLDANNNTTNTLDVVFPVDLGFDAGSGLAVYRTQGDRTLEASAYPTLGVPADAARGIVAQVIGGDVTHELLGLVAGDGLPSPFIGVGNDEQINWLAIDRQPAVHALAGLTHGNLLSVNSPCEELVYAEYAVAGEPHPGNLVWVVEPCNPFGNWRTSVPNVQSAALPAGIVIADPNVFVVANEDAPDGKPFDIDIRTSLFLADLNGDNREDIIVAAAPGQSDYERTLYMALRMPPDPDPDVETGFFPFEPAPCFVSTGIECSSVFGHPLAIADINGDMRADVVFERGITLSPDSFGEVSAVAFSGYSWSTAVVADFDRDGVPDIAGARLDRDDEEPESEADLTPGIEVLRNHDNGIFSKEIIPTDRPIVYMQTGDFDGDLVDDLAYIELDESINVSNDKLFVAFGATSGGLTPPRKVGELPFVDQIIAGPVIGADGATDLVALASPGEDENLALALFAGNTSRQLVSPFLFTIRVGVMGQEVQLSTSIVGMAHGIFEAGAESQLAVVTEPNIPDLPDPNVDPPDAPEVIWRVNVVGDAVLQSKPPPDSNPQPINCYDCFLGAIDLDGDGIDSLLVFDSDPNNDNGRIQQFEAGPNDDLGFAPLGELWSSAGVVFPTDTEEGVLNVPVVDDFDGDGDEDLAVMGEDANTELPVIVVFFNEDGAFGTTTILDAPPTNASETNFINHFTFIQADGDPGLEMVVALIDDSYEFGEVLLMDFDPEDHSYGADDMSRRPLLPAHDGPAFPIALNRGDFDGDGVQDLVIGGDDSFAIVRGRPFAAGEFGFGPTEAP